MRNEKNITFSPTLWNLSDISDPKNPCPTKSANVHRIVGYLQVVWRNKCTVIIWLWWYCWWFRNPANQLRLVVYPIIYRVLYIAGGAAFLPSTCSFWEPILDIPKLHQAVSRAEAVVEECGMLGEATQEEAIVATAGWAVGKWMGGKTCESWAKGPWKGFPLRKPFGMQLTVSAKVFFWNGERFFFSG